MKLSDIMKTSVVRCSPDETLAGPDGDGVIAAVGAEAQALPFGEDPEPAVAPADVEGDDQAEDWPE